jgi:hypothetical protein
MDPSLVSQYTLSPTAIGANQPMRSCPGTFDEVPRKEAFFFSWSS